MAHLNGKPVNLANRPGWSDVEAAGREDSAPRYESPSQFVQGTMFKLERMKRHLHVLRDIRAEYPTDDGAAFSDAIFHVQRCMDRNVIDVIKAGLRDLDEI